MTPEIHRILKKKKKAEYIETESREVVTRDRKGEDGEMEVKGT
jgi:hypothetical protein